MTTIMTIRMIPVIFYDMSSGPSAPCPSNLKEAVT